MGRVFLLGWKSLRCQKDARQPQWGLSTSMWEAQWVGKWLLEQRNLQTKPVWTTLPHYQTRELATRNNVELRTRKVQTTVSQLAGKSLGAHRKIIWIFFCILSVNLDYQHPAFLSSPSTLFRSFKMALYHRGRNVHIGSTTQSHPGKHSQTYGITSDESSGLLPNISHLVKLFCFKL